MNEAEERLQRYFDGELEETERRRLESELTDDDRERLAALGEIRLLLNNTLAGGAEVDLWPGLVEGIQLSSHASQTKSASAKAWLRRWRDRSRWVPASAGLLAAAALLLVMFSPWHHRPPTNGCDIETLEFAGAVATVMQVQDAHHGGDATTTIIWAEED